MKGYYEDRFRAMLPRRAYTLIRVDGKAFHTYTANLDKPFDIGLVEDMNLTAVKLCESIMGAQLAYVQSDEISILITDFDKLETQAWFDGNLQKICSVSASIATSAFNEARMKRWFSDSYDSFAERWPTNWPKIGQFDSRVFQIPCKTEVENYLIWRQQDATRNSISSVAQSMYSHKELEGKNSSQLQEMIFQRGTNWNDLDDGLKRGRVIMRMVAQKVIRQNVIIDVDSWQARSAPIFTRDRMFLDWLIPELDPREPVNDEIL